MSDQQLYMATGLPAVVALIGILVNIGYFVAINGRIAALETCISALETRIDNRITSLEAKFDTKIDLIVGKIVDLDNRFIRLEERLKH